MQTIAVLATPKQIGRPNVQLDPQQRRLSELDLGPAKEVDELQTGSIVQKRAGNAEEKGRPSHGHNAVVTVLRKLRCYTVNKVPLGYTGVTILHGNDHQINVLGTMKELHGRNTTEISERLSAIVRTCAGRTLTRLCTLFVFQQP